jgi:hypothetical protein
VIKKLTIAAMFVLLVSIFAAGFQAQAATCRRFVITILDDPYLAHPICTELPVPVEAWNVVGRGVRIGGGI